MSRPRKPNHLKVISGTDQPCRMNADEDIGAHAYEELPAPPTWLANSHATVEYKRLGAILLRHGRLTETNISVFGVYCSVHGKIVQLTAAGETPTGFLLSQYRALANDFGLITGTSTSARKIASEPEKQGRFDRFKKPD